MVDVRPKRDGRNTITLATYINYVSVIEIHMWKFILFNPRIGRYLNYKLYKSERSSLYKFILIHVIKDTIKVKIVHRPPTSVKRRSRLGMMDTRNSTNVYVFRSIGQNR